MLTKHFADQLKILREKSVEFSAAYPALAPHLNGPKPDPDVERLSEGVAYLLATILCKTNLDLPVLNHILANLLLPQLMRAIPSSTLIEFTSNSDGKTITIPEGVLLKSLPVIDGMQCLFSTTCELDIQPVEITDAGFTPKGAGGEIWLKMALKGGIRLSEWKPGTLTIYLTDDYPTASELYFLLCRKLKNITLTPSVGGAAVTLHRSCLTAAGFSESDAALPYPSQALSGFRIIQEFFHMPGKFLAFHLTGFEEWETRGQWIEFTICFELDTLSSPPPRICRKSFAINTVPAVNIFPHDAAPISLNQRKNRYLIRPSGNPAHFQIHAIESVTGFLRKTMCERNYIPFEMFNDDNSDEPYYHAMPEKSLSHEGYDYHLSVTSPGEEPFPDSETLSIELQCTNGSLPENLRIGDISIPVSTLPDSVSFTNITSIAPYVAPPLGPELQQQLITALAINQKPTSTKETLQALLKMYLFPDNNPCGATAANMKRISGIEAFEVKPGEQSVGGILMRGSEIHIKMRRDHFAGEGDTYLFGCVLDHFLGVSSAINSYTRLKVYETTRGVTYNWPIRIGNCNNDGLVFKSDLPKRKYQQNIRQNENTSRREKNSDTGALLDDLLANGHQYSYYQAMRVARRVFGPGGKEHIPGIPWQKRVHIRPELSFAFPAADISKIERCKKSSDIFITTTFLGLYGTSSPLPNFYSEDIMDEELEGFSTNRDLIDILHQKIYHLLFKAWSKHRLYIRAVEDKDSNIRTLLDCLIGYGEKEQRDSQPGYQSLLPYTAIISQNPRSALGLQAILRHAFGINCIEIEQCVERKTPIPDDQLFRLGISGNCLGVNTVLGRRIEDRMGKIRIHVGPLTAQEYDSFLPGAPNHAKLRWLMQRLMQQPLEYDMKLILAAGEAKPMPLGGPDGPKLGTRWVLFSGGGTWNEEIWKILPLSTLPEEATTTKELTNSVNSVNSEPKTLIEHYQQQLAQLNDLAVRYVQFHPNLAPMMGGKSADTGIQRLFQLVAFLIANLHLKLSDDFPEIIHGVIDEIQPNQLRPIPATTIIAFTPKPTCTTSQMIPVGTALKSVPVDGKECRFTTRYPVEIHPLTLIDATFLHPTGKPPMIILSMELTGIRLDDWKIKGLRIFLGGEDTNASNLYLLLLRYLKQITIEPAGSGKSVVLDPAQIKPVGFEDEEALLPSPANGAVNIQLVQEFFTQQDKFKFIDLQGFDEWRERGEGTRFEIRFEMNKPPFELHKVSKADFALFATPVVNLFKYEAEPIVLDNRESGYPIIPSGDTPEQYEVYSIKEVIGLLDKTSEKIEITSRQRNSPFHLSPVYQITRNRSPVHQGLDTFISVEAPPKTDLRGMSLNVDLLCSNGRLPEKLQQGDICIHTDNAPDYADFTNIKPVNGGMYNVIGNNYLWRLFSLNAMNLHNLTKENLCAVLKLICRSTTQNYIMQMHNEKCIDSILSIHIKAIDRIIDKSMRRGWEIRIKLNRDSFSSHGEMYLFGAILDHFLSGFTSQLCFTRTFIEDVQSEKVYEWPAKMGRRALI